jgi:hypothetical protein
MTGNYRAKLSSGRTITAKATGKTIEVFGVTVAEVDDQFRIKFLETFWEPDQMFRQLVSEGLEEIHDDDKLQEGETVEEISVAGACPVSR